MYTCICAFNGCVYTMTKHPHVVMINNGCVYRMTKPAQWIHWVEADSEEKGLLEGNGNLKYSTAHRLGNPG